MSRMAKPKRPRDPNQLAKMVVALSVGDAEDAPETAKARSGRAGGLKGGATRMAGLSPTQRSELGRKAAAKRWKKPAPGEGAG